MDIAKDRAVMAEFGVTAADIKGKSTAGRASGADKPKRQVTAKYHNRATGTGPRHRDIATYWSWT